MFALKTVAPPLPPQRMLIDHVQKAKKNQQQTFKLELFKMGIQTSILSDPAALTSYCIAATSAQLWTHTHTHSQAHEERRLDFGLFWMPVITAGPVMNGRGGLANAKANGALKHKKNVQVWSAKGWLITAREKTRSKLQGSDYSFWTGTDRGRFFFFFFFFQRAPTPSPTAQLRPPVQGLAVNHLITDVKFTQMECGWSLPGN